jgi:23S rRNA (cytosine1962-C5)-methyltransferase
MTDDSVLRLRKDEERRIRAGHLWVFSNEIDVRQTPLVGLEPGQPVVVEDSRGNFVGSGYANPNSLIAVRLLTREPRRRIDRELVRERLSRALESRQALFGDQPYYRLAFGEGDRLPGLVIDRFDRIHVVQPTTAGMDRLLPDVVESLVELADPGGILVRADSPARLNEGLSLYSRPAYGTVPESVELRENGVRFQAPIREGQKTGWFYDHRINRNRLRRYVEGRRVLDLFSYVGAWGVQAAVFGAREVVCVDSSEPALREAAENATLNGVGDRVSLLRGDAFDLLDQLRERGERFDVVVLDPPAFVKRKKDLRKGEQAYRRLNRLAIDLLAPRGILISASCSFHLDRDTLLRAINWAATNARREAQVVEEGHQGPDHPIHPAIPETSYLKVFTTRLLD